MIDADFELRRELIRANCSIKTTLKSCIVTVSMDYFRHILNSDPTHSDLAKDVINNLDQELKEIENELRSKEDTTNKGIHIQYP